MPGSQPGDGSSILPGDTTKVVGSLLRNDFCMKPIDYDRAFKTYPTRYPLAVYHQPSVRLPSPLILLILGRGTLAQAVRFSSHGSQRVHSAAPVIRVSK